MKKISKQLYLEYEQHLKLEKIAKEKNISQSELLREALKQYLKDQS